MLHTTQAQPSDQPENLSGAKMRVEGVAFVPAYLNMLRPMYQQAVKTVVAIY